MEIYWHILQICTGIFVIHLREMHHAMWPPISTDEKPWLSLITTPAYQQKSAPENGWIYKHTLNGHVFECALIWLIILVLLLDICRYSPKTCFLRRVNVGPVIRVMAMSICTRLRVLRDEEFVLFHLRATFSLASQVVRLRVPKKKTELSFLHITKLRGWHDTPGCCSCASLEANFVLNSSGARLRRQTCKQIH